MADERIERRLAAILAADVVGYSRLMGDDEAGTRARFNAHLDERIWPTIARKRGRIVKTAGDALLVEFASVVDAVECAVEIQNGMARRNADEADGRRMVFRIGVNLGEVIVEGDDIHGDGVNLAARLEGLCAPGEVYVSATVYDQTVGKLAASFEDLGEKTVKNIAKPVRVYRARAPSEDAAKPARMPEPLPLPDKPSIAVLPFANMSGEADQEYFSDGITEDIIMALSRIRQFFVIARNTTFTYKGQAVDLQAVSKDLGVRYVLEGSVRKAGNRVRVSAQLIDGETGNHVWAEKYDRDLEDIFAVQDEITQTVVGTLGPQISRAEQDRARRKPPDSLDAWDLYQQGMWHVSQGTENDFHEALRLFGEAATRDPGFSAAHSGTGYVYARMVVHGFMNDIVAAGDAALAAAKKAIALDDGDEMAHWVAGYAYSVARHEPDLAMLELNKAIDLNPNSAISHAQLGQVHAFYGNVSECFHELDLALRISPRDHYAWRGMMYRAYGHYFLHQYVEAGQGARTASLAPNARFWCLACCVAANAQLGAIDRARVDMDELLRRTSAFSESFVIARGPFEPVRRQHLLEGLNKAGLPKR